MTSLIPMYLKTTYKNDPMFKETKTVFTIYDNFFDHKFNNDLIDKVKMIDIEDSMLNHLKSADFEGFIKLGAEYSDAVIKADDEFDKALHALVEDLSKEKKIDTIEKDENFLDSYYNLYNELVG